MNSTFPYTFNATMVVMDATPKLVRGPAFHLEGDGRWDVQELPDAVLRDAEYSGEINVDGSPAVVFEMPDGDQWSQRAPGQAAPKGDTGEGDEAVDEALSKLGAVVASGFISDPFERMGRNVLARRPLERSQIMSAQAMLEELDASRAALDKALRHARSLASSEASFEWISEQLESRREDLDGVSSGIKDALDYVLRD